ncbi:MAG: hypothetical protein AAFX93_19980 [Verrucomicrobiota bacterium]
MNQNEVSLEDCREPSYLDDPVDHIEPKNEPEREAAAVVSRLIYWLLSGGSLVSIGARVILLGINLGLEVPGFKNFSDIARRSKLTRAAIQEADEELREMFGVRNINHRPKVRECKKRNV